MRLQTRALPLLAIAALTACSTLNTPGDSRPGDLGSYAYRGEPACPYMGYPVTSSAGVARAGVLLAHSPSALTAAARAQGADAVVGIRRWSRRAGQPEWTGTAIKFTQPDCKR